MDKTLERGDKRKRKRYNNFHIESVRVVKSDVGRCWPGAENRQIVPRATFVVFLLSTSEITFRRHRKLLSFFRLPGPGRVFTRMSKNKLNLTLPPGVADNQQPVSPSAPLSAASDAG